MLTPVTESLCLALPQGQVPPLKCFSWGEERGSERRAVSPGTGTSVKGGGKGKDYSLPNPEEIAWEGVCPAAPTEQAILAGQPASPLPCHPSIMQEGRLPGLTTLPFVGGCLQSSLHSSLGLTCPSGCPPSPQSCLSGQALRIPRRSPGAASGPGVALPGRCEGAAGCQDVYPGQVAFPSPPIAGASAMPGPW